MPSQSEKAQRFVALHQREGVFVIPNPWDAASARVLSALGFEALATTSSGFAIQIGEPDGARAVGRAAALANCREICEATHLPVNGDLENCYADDPRTAAQTIALAAEAGLVGCGGDGGGVVVVAAAALPTSFPCGLKAIWPDT